MKNPRVLWGMRVFLFEGASIVKSSPKLIII
ncbi:MAG: hypothetical protein H6Q49_397 [Deltaproteobacteria bacterium]|nr:hypothetical protein [Deltaproteobacteria bacterium]